MTNIMLSAAPSMDFAERMAYGLQVFVVGLGTVFAVLVILWLALVLFKVFSYDLPQKKAKKLAEEAASKVEAAPIVEETPISVIEEPVSDDTQLIAVITAAIAAYNAQSGNSLPFRVVSFKRAGGANGWSGK
ncbi:MAG: OadG family protein [Clostridia bacterium]|nr:OadG family protein [Clostridia bacterium]